MELKGGLQRTGALDVAAIQRQATHEGFTALVLPGHGVIDRSSFFDAVRETLPLDPPLVGSLSWDALSDSLWEGLYEHSSKRLAIIWPGAGDMATRAAADFETALNVLAEVANLLADQQATLGATKEVAVLVEVL